MEFLVQAEREAKLGATTQECLDGPTRSAAIEGFCEMLVGRGLIARAFADLAADPAIKIFASGVSNSLETSRDAFNREQELLESEIGGYSGLFVYFGTASIHDASETARPYVKHKLAMESLVAKSCNAFMIFRLPQVAGANAKPNTIIEFFRQQIESGQLFEVWEHARRRIIDVDDVATVCRSLVTRASARNLAFDLVPPVSISAEEIVKELEDILGRRARYSLIDKGGDLAVDVAPFVTLANELGLQFDDVYPRRTIRKYFGGVAS